MAHPCRNGFAVGTVIIIRPDLHSIDKTIRLAVAFRQQEAFELPTAVSIRFHSP
jgi:hypothetical protein